MVDGRDKYKVAVVMPALNEAESVGQAIRGVRDAFSKSAVPVVADVVVVDGNSTDGTVSSAKAEGARVIIQKNTGYGDALYSGFLYSRDELNSDIICTIDADGSYDPEGLVSGVSELVGDRLDLVVCARVPDVGAMNVINRLGNRLISALVKVILGIKVSDSQSGMFIFWADLVDNIHPKVRGWAFNTEVLTRALESEYRIGEIRVSYRKRVGNTKLSVVTGGLVNIGVILRMLRDSRPLLFHGTIAVVLLLSAIPMGIETIIKSSQLLAILTALVALAGVQILTFGLVADMIKDVRTGQLKKAVPYRKAE
jgi:glycosyltransferase involved in cell wall biosynthesis